MAVVSACVVHLAPTRLSALRESTEGAKARSFDRYLRAPEKIRARWAVFRAAGIVASAAMLTSIFSPDDPQSWLQSSGLALLAYVVPSELLRGQLSKHAQNWLPHLLQLSRPAEWLVAPISDPLHFLGVWLRGSVEREPSATLTETEVELLVNEGELNGSLDHEQSEMIRNVLDFGEVTAEELMVPRTQVDALDAHLSISDALAEVMRSQHSRYPVYRDSIDNVSGILHVKDLFQTMVGPGLETTNLMDLARKPVAFVSEGQLASTVLRDMRAGRHHMAVVLDEFGGVAGVLTLEDLLEEIVGDIQDEHDHDEAQRIVMIEEHIALVDAATPIADINRAIGTELPDGDYVSLGGLLLEELGNVPPAGTTFEMHGLRGVIRDSDERRIMQVELADVPGAPRDPSTRPPASAA